MNKRSNKYRNKNSSSKSKPLNKKDSSKDMRRAAEIEGTSKEIYLSKDNPYTWYANFPQFAKDVATLAFGTPVGQTIPLGNGDFIGAAGIMALYFTPTPGYSVDLTSPINRQATRIYTYLRSIQRSASSYDAADLMMYLMGVDSLYTYWAYLRRIYGVAQLFTPTNKYYPRRLLQAMGVEPDTLLNNLADFRAYVNRFALNIGRYAMPKQFDITYRHMWMASGLYLDSNTSRAQTYLFTPTMLYQWDNTVATGSQLVGSALDSLTANIAFKTVSDLVTYGQNLLNNFENDEDTMNISGDLYRAYGESGLMRVEETADNYAVIPVYSAEVLSQIENSILVGTYTDVTGTPTIKQDPSVNNGAIICDIKVSAGRTAINESLEGLNYPFIMNTSFMNMHMDSPSSESVMEATRLMPKYAGNENIILYPATQGIAGSVGSSGADFINYMRICAPSASNQNAVRFLFSPTNTIWIDSTDGTPSIDPDAAELLAVIQQFDWAPMLYLIKATSSTTWDMLQVAADLDNFTAVTKQQLYNIHEAAMLSVLDAPQPIIH